jgi:predicted MPP superfamily phosphohydrolase
VSRLLSFALFFVLLLSVLGGAHYYAWTRLVRDLALPPNQQRLLTLVFVLLFALVPLSFFVRRAGSLLAAPVVWVSSIWIGVLLLLLVTLLAGDFLRGLTALGMRLTDAPPADPERRVALARLFALVVVGLTGGLTAWAVKSGLAGTTIVQLTDVHVGHTIRRDFIEEIVAQTNALKPDVIAITGDLVDGSVAELRDHVAPLGKLEARWGVYFVTGNHEYYSGADEWIAELGRLGIRVLRNERVVVGNGEASYDLCGIDDHQAAQFGGDHGPDLARACAGRDPERELVLLAHQPRAVFEAEKHGVGLQLSGHTHGGQIWPWRYMVRLQQPIVSGLAAFGQTQVYVSNGTGYWGPPMRLAAPAEITRIRLSPA